MMDKEEKASDREIVLRGKGAEWFDNFWYHYKWVVIGVALAVIVILVCTLQTCSKEKKDITVTYAGPVVLTSGDIDQICAAMGAVMPEDHDGDGDRNAALVLYHLYSEAQLHELKADPEGYHDNGRNSEEYRQFRTYIQTGDSSVYFLDPWLYEELKSDGVLYPLSELSGISSDASLDGYGVRLGDTDLYKKYAVMQKLPEDTVICLMSDLVWGNSSKEENYAFSQEMYKAIVNYKKD